MKKVFSEKELPDIATEAIAYIAKHANKTAATVVALSGDLGAGKTSLVQAIALELGIDEKIISPTFVLLKSYKLKSTNHKTLHHIDAYRLTKPDHIHHIGWTELVADPSNLILLEWPEQIGMFLPKEVIKIKLKHKARDTREISIK